MFVAEKQVFHWRHAKRNKHEINMCTRLLFGVMLVSVSSGSSIAAPSGGLVINGSATIGGTATDVTVNQTTARTDINWQSFDTAAAESITFTQPTAAAVAINRVVNGLPTQFNGALNANGRIFVINRNGITFGGGAQVNVGALLATTSDTPVNRELSNFVFDDADYSGTGGEGDGVGVNNVQQVINNGQIVASDGGFAVLAAPYVENNGLIRANLGQAEMDSTGNYTLHVDLRGDGLISFAVSDNLTGARVKGSRLGVKNAGTLQAQSGHIYLTANMASSIVQSVINLDGVVDADQFAPGGAGGTVLVDSRQGDIVIGNADVHAVGGKTVSGSFMARDNIRSGDSAVASIDLRAVDAPSTGDADTSADLSMQAGRGGAGVIDIDTTAITVKANSDTGDDYDSAHASANAEFGAQGDIRIMGDITLDAIADSRTPDSSAGFGEDASADAAVSMRATGGGIGLNGDLKVAAAAHGGSYYGDANARSRAILRADDDLTVDGNVSVAAAAENLNPDTDKAYGYDVFAFANLYMNAGLDRSGSLAINGDIHVDTDARENGTDTASASANVQLWAANDIRINTAGGDTVHVAANTVHSGTGASYVQADASLNVLAAQHGPGGIEINGPIEVLADSNRSLADSNDSDVTANANANLKALDDIRIEGDTRVDAKAHNEGTDSDASANARLTEWSDDGSLSIIGDISVLSDAFMGSHATDTASAYANARLGARHDVTLNGDTLVSAIADNQGTEDNAEAYARLGVEAREGDLSVTGSVGVVAHGTVGTQPHTRYADADTHVDAFGELLAGGSIAGHGKARVEALATNKALNPEQTDAHARLNMHAGQYEDTASIAWSGGTEVIAGADRQHSGMTSDNAAFAEAHLDVDAPGDVTLNGPVNVQSTASNVGSDSSTSPWSFSSGSSGSSGSSSGVFEGSAPAVAVADAFVRGEEGDVSIIGDVNVGADADVSSDSSEFSGGLAAAFATLDVKGMGGKKRTSSGSDVTHKGNMDVHANARNTWGSFATAGAVASLQAAGNLSVTGGRQQVGTDAQGLGGSSPAPSFNADIFSRYILERHDAEVDLDSFLPVGLIPGSEAGYAALADGTLSFTSDLVVSANVQNPMGFRLENNPEKTKRSGGSFYDGTGNATVALASGLLASGGDQVTRGDVDVRVAANTNATGIRANNSGLVFGGFLAEAGMDGTEVGGLAGTLFDTGLSGLEGLADVGVRSSTLDFDGTAMVNADVVADSGRPEGEGGSGYDSTAIAGALGVIAAGGDANVNGGGMQVSSRAVNKGAGDFGGLGAILPESEGEGVSLLPVSMDLSMLSRVPPAIAGSGNLVVAGLSDFVGREVEGGVPGNLNFSGDFSSYARADSGSGMGNYAVGGTVLAAAGDVTGVVCPLPNATGVAGPMAHVAGDETLWQGCADGECTDATPGFGVEGLAAAFESDQVSLAQLIIEAGGDVEIAVSCGNDLPEERLIDPPGPLSIGQPGSGPTIFNQAGFLQPDLELSMQIPQRSEEDLLELIANGEGDPAALLEATAAGPMGGSPTTYCDTGLVNGGCVAENERQSKVK